MKSKSSKIIEREVIDACIDIAIKNSRHGCIFVIDLNKKKKFNYYTKVFQSIKGENGKRLSVRNDKDKHIIRHLATMDGATVIDRNGELREFGVTLNRQSTFFGHGKRHAFALGTSTIGNLVCILASEEDRHVRLFNEGICIVSIDPIGHVPKDLRQKIADIIDMPLSSLIKKAGISKTKLASHPEPALIKITGSSIVVSQGFEGIWKLL
jgi:DNA integrity scanning protein DisA with diadenylate cyclase activity